MNDLSGVGRRVLCLPGASPYEPSRRGAVGGPGGVGEGSAAGSEVCPASCATAAAGREGGRCLGGGGRDDGDACAGRRRAHGGAARQAAVSAGGGQPRRCGG